MSKPRIDAHGNDAPVPPHIVDAARHVLAQDGLAAATLERISSAAGVSRMTLHRRGVTKEHILRTLAQQLEAAYRDAVWPALVSKGTGRERLELALDLQCQVTESNLETLQALSEATRGEIYHEGALTRREFVEPLERLLIDGAADGTLRALDSEETATLLFNAVGHTYRHLRSGHGWDPDRARAGVVRLMIEGVAAEAGR
jgi:AcrR family transcriptional regulator